MLTSGLTCCLIQKQATFARLLVRHSLYIRRVYLLVVWVWILCRLSDSQITDNILLLLLAGHDTSSSTLTQCFSNLQDHPAVLQRLRNEQQAVVAKHGEQITTAALRDMHYAEAVIR